MRWLGPVLMILALIVVIASGPEDGAIIPALLLGAAGVCAWHRSTKKSATPLADPPREVTPLRPIPGTDVWLGSPLP